MTHITQLEIDRRVFDLYDEYCHGGIERREFLKRAAALGAAGLAMAQAQTISFTDNRIKATYVEYPSPGGNSGKMRGYLAQPAGAGPQSVHRGCGAARGGGGVPGAGARRAGTGRRLPGQR